MIRWNHKRFVQSLSKYWAAQRPAMVVSLVPNFNREMADALARVMPGSPFVTVMTDLADCPPRFWAEPKTQQILVCGSPYAMAQARTAGCAPHRIWETSGMLLGEQFHQPITIDRVQARVRLGLPPEQPVGLVLFGSEGSKEMLAIAQRLSNTPLVLACGRNAKLAQALRALPRKAPSVVLDYTREMAHYMHLADFFIGKPGSGSLSEAVHMGLPPLVVRNAWTMPQERYCTDWVQEKKLGIVLPSFKGVAAGVEVLLADLPRYKAATRQLRNRAGDEVPDVLAQILQQSSWARLQSQKAA